jgi:hypothetical protein
MLPHIEPHLIPCPAIPIEAALLALWPGQTPEKAHCGGKLSTRKVLPTGQLVRLILAGHRGWRLRLMENQAFSET